MWREELCSRSALGDVPSSEKLRHKRIALDVVDVALNKQCHLHQQIWIDQFEVNSHVDLYYANHKKCKSAKSQGSQSGLHLLLCWRTWTLVSQLRGSKVAMFHMFARGASVTMAFQRHQLLLPRMQFQVHLHPYVRWGLSEWPWRGSRFGGEREDFQRKISDHEDYEEIDLEDCDGGLNWSLILEFQWSIWCLDCPPARSAFLLSNGQWICQTWRRSCVLYSCHGSLWNVRSWESKFGLGNSKSSLWNLLQALKVLSGNKSATSSSFHFINFFHQDLFVETVES